MLDKRERERAERAAASHPIGHSRRFKNNERKNASTTTTRKMCDLGKTRASGACFGSLETLDGYDARSVGSRAQITLCLKHKKFRQSLTSRCCFPAKWLDQAGPCGGQLCCAPVRMMGTLDAFARRDRAVGTLMCRKHLSAWDNLPQIQEHPNYEPPSKRRRCPQPQVSVQAFKRRAEVALVCNQADVPCPLCSLSVHS